mgnify:CR=1 FL=1|jgi:hypothetical protein
MKVRLTKDLTAYGPTLVQGAEGIAREDKIEINDWEQEMIEVKIPGSEALPIGWNALEIIDKKFWKDRETAVKRATCITLRVGPRGGYKGMCIEWVDGKGNQKLVWCNNKLEAERTMELAKKYDKCVYRDVV